GQLHHVAQVTDGAAVGLKRADQGPTACDRLEATGVAAETWHARGRGWRVVPEPPRRLHRTALQRPAGDDAGAQPRRCLEHEQIVEALALAGALGHSDD